MSFLLIFKTTSLKILNYSIYFFLCVFLLSSCYNSRPVAYFQDGKLDTSITHSIEIPEYVVQKGDILNITIYSDNPEATAIFNQASAGMSNINQSSGKGAAATSNVANGYLVDREGNIRLHAIGLLHVEGLTKRSIESQIIEKLQVLGVLTSPYCVVRLSNFRITVLGEVTAPGVYSMPSEKASILDAIGQAGDLTIYGRKDQILLIRESMGRRTYTDIDLTKPDIFTSPNFYLQNNDVLVVKADRKKTTPADQQTLQLITIGLTALSTLAILLTIFK
jgi:polysaccharide export outer membrane protein